MFSAHKMNITLVITYPVAVVNCPVHDENFLYFRELQKLTGGDGHRVEVAEAHGFFCLRVVPRWADNSEPILKLIHGNFLHEVDHGADGKPGRCRCMKLVPIRVRVHAGSATRKQSEFVQGPLEILTMKHIYKGY